MVKVKAFQDFITPEEKTILNEWTLDNYKQDYFTDPKMDSNGLVKSKLTTRFATPLIDGNKIVCVSDSNFNYPDLVYYIQRKIIKTFDFKDYGFGPVGKDGIISEISFTGGTVHPHTDPEWFIGMDTVHCNLITQKPQSGGVTFIEEEPWDINETDLLMYIVSQAEHRVDEIVGDKERILWVFSFMLSKSDTMRVFS
tara:strand:+ start:1908 stop:2498 length:591 start_codon:yes stop_codon:yes gene_type:complete